MLGYVHLQHPTMILPMPFFIYSCHIFIKNCNNCNVCNVCNFDADLLFSILFPISNCNHFAKDGIPRQASFALDKNGEAHATALAIHCQEYFFGIFQNAPTEECVCSVADIRGAAEAHPPQVRQRLCELNTRMRPLSHQPAAVRNL